MSENASELRSQPWDADFDFYFSETMKARLVVTVDLGAVDVAPLPTHPLRLQARITMQSPRPDGLRQLGEADALFALEDRLLDRLGGLLPLVYVGRTVAAGDVTLVWYSPRSAEQQREQLAQAVQAERGDYEVHLSLAEDSEWRFYHDFLFPDVYNLQVMLNRRRLLTLAEHGDDGSRPRELEHIAYFPTQQQARDAAERLAFCDFTVDEPLLDGTAPVDDDLPWSLRFTRTDPLADGRVDEVCIEVVDVVLAHDGFYDGWGSRLLGP